MKLSFPQMLLALSARTQSSKDTSTTSVEATTNSVAPAIWDGTCFYPQADDNFDLSSYPGRWYQVAGTLAPFTAGCKCISALYALNVCIVINSQLFSHNLTLHSRTTAASTSTTLASEATSEPLLRALQLQLPKNMAKSVS